MARLLKVKDRVIQAETPHVQRGGIGGHVIFGRGKHLVPYTDPYGSLVYRTEFDEILFEDDNIVPIGGYQFAFDKLFNIAPDKETTLRVGDLNDEAPQMKIGVPKGEYKSSYYTAECGAPGSGVPIREGINISALNYICGFMIGDGGSREDNETVIAPDYKRRFLFHPVPFRMSNDGKPLPENKYYGKSTTAAGATGMEPITSYYMKTFDDPAPHIVHQWVTEDDDEVQIVDDTVFASTSSLDIESYVEINLTVSPYDGRSYSTALGSMPKVNEFALVSGWFNPEKNDYECLRMFTHFTRPPVMLTTSDAIEVCYRLYSR